MAEPVKPPPPEDIQIKPDRVLLAKIRILTTPGMRELIAKVQKAGYEERVEKLLDITANGIILGVSPPIKEDGHVDLSCLEEFMVAQALTISQVSFRGIVDNNFIYQTRSAVEILKQHVATAAGLDPRGPQVPVPPPGARKAVRGYGDGKATYGDKGTPHG